MLTSCRLLMCRGATPTSWEMRAVRARGPGGGERSLRDSPAHCSWRDTGTRAAAGKQAEMSTVAVLGPGGAARRWVTVSFWKKAEVLLWAE